MSKARYEYIIDQTVGPRVLDIGCVGQSTHQHHKDWLHGKLRDRFDHVVGIDRSRKNIEWMKRNGFDDVHDMSAEDFDLDQKFDTIVAGELIEHLPNPGKFLDNAKRHLNDNGRIVITTPYPFSLFYSIWAVLHYPQTCSNEEHACWFCRSTIRELAARSGLVVDQFELIQCYERNHPSWSYRVFERFIRYFNRCIPRRLSGNHMLVVLKSKKD